MTEYERPEPGTWVQVWGQVVEEVGIPLEETMVRLRSKTDEFHVYVRTDRLVVPEQPPSFAPKCTALYDAGGGMLWRCSQTRDHAGSHIANRGSLAWGGSETVGYIEEP